MQSSPAGLPAGVVTVNVTTFANLQLIPDSACGAPLQPRSPPQTAPLHPVSTSELNLCWRCPIRRTLRQTFEAQFSSLLSPLLPPHHPAQSPATWQALPWCPVMSVCLLRPRRDLSTSSAKVRLSQPCVPRGPAQCSLLGEHLPSDVLMMRVACSPGQRSHHRRGWEEAGQGTLSTAAQLVPRTRALAGPSWRQEEEEGPRRPRAGNPHPSDAGPPGWSQWARTRGCESPGPQAHGHQLHLSSLRPRGPRGGSGVPRRPGSSHGNRGAGPHGRVTAATPRWASASSRVTWGRDLQGEAARGHTPHAAGNRRGCPCPALSDSAQHVRRIRTRLRFRSVTSF